MGKMINNYTPQEQKNIELFRVENGKLAEFIKEWNKLSMWEQFGWPIEECLTQKE
ncbi:hypothetical protein NSTC731_04266 [Nostoc sp. DSM 114167]|jgi:hypothetical protein